MGSCVGGGLTGPFLSWAQDVKGFGDGAEVAWGGFGRVQQLERGESVVLSLQMTGGAPKF